jgi:hypothetical protein
MEDTGTHTVDNRRKESNSQTVKILEKRKLYSCSQSTDDIKRYSYSKNKGEQKIGGSILYSYKKN